MLPPYKFPLHCVNFIDLDKWRRTTLNAIHLPYCWKSLHLDSVCHQCSLVAPRFDSLPLSSLLLSLSPHKKRENLICQKRSESERKESREKERDWKWKTGKKNYLDRMMAFYSFCALWWHKYPIDLIFNHIMYIVCTKIVCHFIRVFIRWIERHHIHKPVRLCSVFRSIFSMW